MTRKHLAVWAAFGSVLAGCGHDEPPRVAYVPPAATAAADAVTLKGENATFINAIDDQKVTGEQGYSTVPFAGMKGGNEVTVTPGRHVIEVNVYTSGATFNGKRTDARVLEAEAGHTYRFAAGEGFGRRLQVRDLTTGTVLRLAAP